MKKIFFCGLLLLASCEKVDLQSVLEEPQHPTENTTDNQGEPLQEVLLTENDTARFYLSGTELSDITLTAYPTPQTLITDPRYRMPTKSESSLFRLLPAPDGYWQSRQRILCYDSESNAYYTFEFNGTSTTKAGQKTTYCLLPIRTEHIYSPIDTLGLHIDINDQWE